MGPSALARPPSALPSPPPPPPLSLRASPPPSGRADAPYPPPHLQELASNVLAAVLAHDVGDGGGGDAEPRRQQLAAFVKHLSGQLRQPGGGERGPAAALHGLSRVLRRREAREIFLAAGGLGALAECLKAPLGGAQAQYEAGLCAWLLSYLPQVPAQAQPLGLLEALVGLARGAQKEKVVRVAVMALRNLLKGAEDGASFDAVELGLPKVVEHLKHGAYGDEELRESLEWLGDRLEGSMEAERSSIDKYRAEVLSGRLDWTVLHKEEAFWRMNAFKFEAQNCDLLKRVLRLVEAGEEPRTVAVALHDLGQVIVHHPRGRTLVQNLRAQALVMRQLESSDAEVQRQALLCTQKIMLSKDSLSFLAQGAQAAG